MNPTASWIAEHALLSWAIVLCVAVLGADLLYWRAARRRRLTEAAGGIHRALAPVLGGLLVVALATLFAAIALALIHGDDSLTRFDTALAAQLRASLSAGQLHAIAQLSQLGNPDALGVITALLMLLLLWRRHLRLALVWGGTLLGTALLNRLLKGIFQRQRPPHEAGLVSEHSFSFPSGHASGAMVFYGMLAYVLLQLTPPRWHRAIIALAALAISLIGISRILLQVHYFSDVLAGYASGLAWLLLCILAAESLRLRATRP